MSAPAACPVLSIILPAFNESQVIRGVIVAAREAAEKISKEYEIIIVNDGSDDMTASVVQQVQDINPRVRCVSHPNRRGYGAAVRSGIDASHGEWIFLTDGDGQFDMNEVPGVFAARGDADIVIGYREHRADSGLRVAYSAGWRNLVAAILGVTARDPNCAFKLMRGDLVRSLDLRSTGALISAELLALAARAGAKIAEVPVSHRPRESGRATGGNPFVILRAFRELGQHMMRIRSGSPTKTP